MPNLKDLRRRIDTVKKTKQITSAMKLVAGAKLKRATDAAVSARPYQAQLSAVLARVAAGVGDAENPLLEQRESVSRILLVILTSDRGLCGPFNNTFMRRVMDFHHDKHAGAVEVDILVYGRKGADFLRYRGVAPKDKIIGYEKTPKLELVQSLSDQMVSGFLDATYDEVYLGYNQFKNVLTQVPTFKRLLPLEMDHGDVEQAQYAFEPSPETLIDALLPLFLRTLVLQAFLETAAGEQAARMTAMDNATRNASDLIDDLSLQYNRARQAAITTEITEIVSGAEAL